MRLSNALATQQFFLDLRDTHFKRTTLSPGAEQEFATAIRAHVPELFGTGRAEGTLIGANIGRLGFAGGRFTLFALLFHF